MSKPSQAVPGAPQDCPVVFVKVSSGDGGFAHALADAMTTSEFQRQLDETEHGGQSKHYLDMRLKNVADRQISAIETVALYTNKTGDEQSSIVLVSQNTDPPPFRWTPMLALRM